MRLPFSDPMYTVRRSGPPKVTLAIHGATPRPVRNRTSCVTAPRKNCCSRASTSAGGTRVIATIVDPEWTAAAVVQRAADAGVALDPLSMSRHSSAPDRELVIDYGHHEPVELRAAIRLLAKSLAPRTVTGGRRPATISTLPTAAARA